MRRKIPNSTTLTCFEASARLSSFTKAADELALTQSAVCRQNSKLEDYLGVRLFQRTRRGVIPTPAGVAYSKKVGTLLDALERDAAELMYQGERGGELTLAVLPTFAHKWLLPKLASFHEKYHRITLNLITRTQLSLLDEPHIDAAIFAGGGQWSGCESHFLLREELAPVCSPLMARTGNRFKPADFARFRLLHLTSRPYAWRAWLEARGISLPNKTAGPRYDIYSLLIEAAANGVGIALVPGFLVERDLAEGRLILLKTAKPMKHKDIPKQMPSEATTSYYLVCPENKHVNHAFVFFRSWLLKEC
jgi:LysR family glycine cleavage system transcriptional activator